MAISKTVQTKNSIKKAYQRPSVDRIALDTEIALSMVSVPPNPMMPQMPEGYVQKILSEISKVYLFRPWIFHFIRFHNHK
jgi:hypothetical protein